MTGYGKTSGKPEIPVEREGNCSAGLWQLSSVVAHPPFLQGCSPGGWSAFLGEAVAFAAAEPGLRRTEGCLGHTACL